MVIDVQLENNSFSGHIYRQNLTELSPTAHKSKAGTMQNIEINAPALAGACTASGPSDKAATGWYRLFMRLFQRKPAPYVVSEHSPDYLLRDLGLMEGRTSRLPRGGHRLPDWR
jgi:hypothetical protein